MRRSWKLLLPLFLCLGILSTAGMLPGPQDSDEAIAQAFLKSFKKKKFKKILPLMPGVDELRLIYPEKTRGKTHDEIYEYLELPAIQRAKHHFHSMIDMAMDKGFDLKTIEITDLKHSPLSSHKGGPIDLDILFEHGFHRSHFDVVVAHLYGKWYIVDIGHREDIFGSLATGITQ